MVGGCYSSILIPSSSVFSRTLSPSYYPFPLSLLLWIIQNWLYTFFLQRMVCHSIFSSLTFPAFLSNIATQRRVMWEISVCYLPSPHLPPPYSSSFPSLSFTSFSFPTLFPSPSAFYYFPLTSPPLSYLFSPSSLPPSLSLLNISYFLFPFPRLFLPPLSRAPLPFPLPLSHPSHMLLIHLLPPASIFLSFSIPPPPPSLFFVCLFHPPPPSPAPPPPLSRLFPLLFLLYQLFFSVILSPNHPTFSF